MRRTLLPTGPRLAPAAAFLSMVLAGCSTIPDARKDADYQSSASTASRPVVRPVRSITSLTPSLACMDQMLRASEVPTTLVSSKYIGDPSGKVAVATKDMVVTSLSQMSRLSNAFRYVDYEVDIARQDTVQNLTTILLNTNQVQLQRPALYFSGSISFVDQNVINSTMAAGVSGTRAEAAYSRNKNATIIGLEMHLGDFRSRTLIPGMDSANEVVVGAGGQGLDLAGRIGTYGVQLNVGRDYALGTGAAVRTLVDLAVIELVGKWARVPYWQCLTLDQTHPDFQRQLRDWFNADGPASQRRLVIAALASRGYLPPAGAPRSPAAMREALGRFQSDERLVVTGVVDFATYERALRDFVATGEDGSLQRVGWDGAGAPARARVIDMQIENVKSDRDTFEVGEQIFVSATVSRASFLTCFYADARGNISRLIPNNSNKSAWVAAGQAVRVPDWMSPNPGFLMDAVSPGREGLACFATDEEPGSALPAVLRGPPLRRIPGVTSLEQVDKAFAATWGADGYTGRALWWDVAQRRAAAAAPAAAPASTPARAAKR